jgi:hypothetical protein
MIFTRIFAVLCPNSEMQVGRNADGEGSRRAMKCHRHPQEIAPYSVAEVATTVTSSAHRLPFWPPQRFRPRVVSHPPSRRHIRSLQKDR